MSKPLWFLYGVLAGVFITLSYITRGAVFSRFVQDFKEGYRVAEAVLRTATE